jgi:hypothetical protein
MFHVPGPAGGDVVAVGSEIGSAGKGICAGGRRIAGRVVPLSSVPAAMSPTQASWCRRPQLAAASDGPAASSRLDTEDGNAANAVQRCRGDQPTRRSRGSRSASRSSPPSRKLSDILTAGATLHIMHRFLRNQRSDRPWFRGRRTNTFPCAPDSLGFSQSHETSRVDFRVKGSNPRPNGRSAVRSGLRTEVRT